MHIRWGRAAQAARPGLRRSVLWVALMGALAWPAMAGAASATSSIAQPIDLYDSAQVKAAVRQQFADAPAMIAAAKCESGYRQYDASGGVLYGGAGDAMIGVFQISRIHVKEARALGMDITTLAGNLAYAKYLYDESGMDPWLSSRKCWSRSLTSAAPMQAAPFRVPLRAGIASGDVLKLQQFLNRAGFAVARSGPGSPGSETDSFGALTRDAVRRFQCARGIICSGSESTTGYGLVGPRTAAALMLAAADADRSAQAQG